MIEKICLQLSADEMERLRELAKELGMSDQELPVFAHQVFVFALNEIRPSDLYSAKGSMEKT